MMKKLFRFMPVAIVLMVGSAFAEITPTQPSAGDGTENNPFQITSAAELYWLAATVNNGECKNYASGGNCSAALANDITLNSNLLGEGNKNVEENGNFDWNGYEKAHNWNDPESWSPIGTGENPYQGTFNGNNKTVSGVFNSDVSNVVGFFGRVGENGVVKNVGVVDSYFNCNMYCGGIVGENDGSVSGVSYAGVVNGGEDVGGIIGKNNGGASVRNVYKTGTVYGSNLVGGIVGDNGASINNAFNMGTVSGSDNVGGVAGQNSGSVSKAYYNTDVTCENCAVVEGTTGKTAAELATINLAEAFPLQGSEMENSWANDISYDKATGKLTSTLPYLKNFPVVPDAETILSFTVASGVIQISTAEDLKNFAKLVNEYDIRDVDAELTTSITLNSNLLGENNANVDAETGIYTGNAPANVWTPIGTRDNRYTGTFDGKGYTVSGLYFNNEKTSYVGLFGYVSGGSIQNIGMIDSYVRGGMYVGGLFGYIDESAKVQNVGVVDSYLKGYSMVGGVVGGNGGGSISNVYNTGSVSGGYYVGGVVGYNVGGTISNAYNTGSVSGTYDYVGGVVGSIDDGSIINVYNTGSVSGTDDYVGGVVGNNYGTVSNVYNTGSVSGDFYVGGVVGNNYGTVSNAYNTGSVSGNRNVGGVVGSIDDGSIINVYNTGSVSGTDDYVGGVVGNNYGTVSNVYNTGSVSGPGDYVGGVVGLDYYGTVSNAYYNTEVTCKNCDVVDGTTGKLSGEFADGTVAMLLHDWCEMDGETCKEGGLNGSIWGQDLAAENSLPDFSGVVGFKYGSITFFNLNDDVADSASIDATAKAPVSITSDIVVTGPITFKRNFSSSGYSTIMLPFTPNCTDDDCVEGVKFFEFNSYTDGEVQATDVSPKDLKANTPYLVQAAGATELVFKNGGVFNTQTGDVYDKVTGVYKKSLANGWSIYGTYAYKTWEEGDAGLGRTYGFAGSTGNDPSIVGKFAKVGAGAYIYPMRAYLEYDVPVSQNRPVAFGETPRNVNASLPETINVVIVDKDETTGEQTTRVIGTLDTHTGEFKFESDRWFDLQGRYLGSKKPTQKGAYYNNGKKVIVK